MTEIGSPRRRKEPSRHTPPPHQSSTAENHHCGARDETEKKTSPLKTEQNGEEPNRGKERWGLSRRWRGAPAAGEEEAKMKKKVDGGWV
ncbi:unnamed protein product [Microthlaspi erraticum]|uniref:Uncharacterized protein n=1 Tax=Microthlaspi erraticum TaxID=1685480 RepID=A0A6D2JKH6_9BRAS|nr:unnamed protein product [Microthlaspi erraticum]CAA7053778.1 unnamed protein product [Microthlaspi erraticum]